MAKLYLAMFAIALMSLVVCSCSEQSSRSDATQKVYRHTFDQAPRNLDPSKASSLYTNFIVLNAYDTLFGYKYLARPYELKPNLAVAMPEVSDDGLTYTIRLKKGALFIDDPCFADGKGREVVAEDFVYSIKRHFDPAVIAQGAWLWQSRIVGLDEWGKQGANYDQPVAGLRALDSHTLQITLTRPYPQLIHTLAQGFSAAVPREAAERYGLELSVHPVGSGPFIVEKFDSTRVVMRRNPTYRQEAVDIYAEGFNPALHGSFGLEAIQGRSPPFVDAIEIAFIADDVARATSLQKRSEANYARIPTSMYDQFLKSKDPIALHDELAGQYHMLASIEPGFVFHTFNMTDPDFGYSDDPQQAARNKALRCAVIKGFDWNERNDRFYSGIGKIFPGIIPPVTPEFDPDMSRDSVTYDPQGAMRLLSEAGWNADNLPEFIYGVPSSVRMTQMYEQFRGFMQKIGYPQEKIVVKQYATFGDISKDWRRARLPLVNKAWGLDYPDAENTLQLFFGPNASPGTNDANYKNPQYDELFRQSSVMLESPERTAIYQQLNQMVIDDCLAMTGLSRTMIYMWHENIIAFPDRHVVGGFWAKYVDFAVPSE